MDIEKYIASGILELYVAGSLSEKENQKVYELMQKYPEIMAEVESIESAIIQLTAGAKTDDSYDFNSLKNEILTKGKKVIPIEKRKTNWIQLSGWAAAFIFGSVLIYTVIQNGKLKQELAIEKEQLEEKIEKASNSLAETKELLEIFRDKNILSIPLDGQKIAPNAYAKVYWDKKSNSIYLDAKGLPEPPEGKVYQVWSLKLSPLTPTSLGTLDNFTADTNKIFNISNLNNSEAFGITLEPAGGSVSPTLEQLYTLGAVSSS